MLNNIHFYRLKPTFNTILTIIAILGVVGLIAIVISTRRELPIVQPIAQPAVSIYKRFIAGSGIIEANTDDIQLGTQIAGVVEKIYVKVGDEVKKGDPLFSLDQRLIMADIAVKQSQVDEAAANVKQAEATLKAAEDQYKLAKQLKDKSAISQAEYLTLENTYLIDKAALETAREALKVAKDFLKQSQVTQQIETICAPLDCEILQVNVHPGEYAAAMGDLVPPLMLLGNTRTLHVRIDVDEEDAWRYEKGAKAIAYLRGNGDIRMDLKYSRLEPYVIPKHNLTGQPTERVDTRVLQPIYEFDPRELPVYTGQQVDVFIEVLSDRPAHTKPGSFRVEKDLP